MKEKPKCPKCKSAQLKSNTKGLEVEKAILFGPVGALIGRKMLMTCLKCGNTWEMEKK